MKEILKHKCGWLTRIFFILLSFFIFSVSVTSASASPINFSQVHHIGISETYVYDEVESSVWLEGDGTGGLSRVLSKEKVGSDGEVLGAVARVAARSSTQTLKFTQKQVWKKFGEHYGEFGLKHGKEGMQQYLKIAKDIHKNPVIKHTFPKGGHYAGETWMMRNQQLLRLDPQGGFRSLYYLK